MAKKQAKQSLTLWNPLNAGEAIEGKFQQFQNSPTGLFLVLDSGVVTIGVVLRKLLKGIHDELKAGDQLVVKFSGKSGRTKVFELAWKGQPVRPAFDVQRPATEDEKNTFFSDEWEFPAQGEKKKGYKA